GDGTPRGRGVVSPGLMGLAASGRLGCRCGAREVGTVARARLTDRGAERLGEAPEAMWHQRNGFVKVTPVDDSRGAVLYTTKQAVLSGDIELSSDTLSRYRDRLTERPRVALYPQDEEERAATRRAPEHPRRSIGPTAPGEAADS